MIASYLVFKHRQKKPLVCPLNHDCTVVTESRWSTIFFGIRNEILGLLFFAALLGAMVITLLRPDMKHILFGWMVLVSGGGLVFAVFLVLIQFYTIKDYCFYCLVSVGITLLIFLNSVSLYLLQ